MQIIFQKSPPMDPHPVEFCPPTTSHHVSWRSALPLSLNPRLVILNVYGSSVKTQNLLTDRAVRLGFYGQSKGPKLLLAVGSNAASFILHNLRWCCADSNSDCMTDSESEEAWAAIRLLPRCKTKKWAKFNHDNTLQKIIASTFFSKGSLTFINVLATTVHTFCYKKKEKKEKKGYTYAWNCYFSKRNMNYLLDLTHGLNKIIELQSFGSWILFPPSFVQVRGKLSHRAQQAKLSFRKVVCGFIIL